jgi:hypothetical protein
MVKRENCGETPDQSEEEFSFSRRNASINRAITGGIKACHFAVKNELKKAGAG